MAALNGARTTAGSCCSAPSGSAPPVSPWAAIRLSISTAIAAEPSTAPTWRVAL